VLEVGRQENGGQIGVGAKWMSGLHIIPVLLHQRREAGMARTDGKPRQDR